MRYALIALGLLPVAAASMRSAADGVGREFARQLSQVSAWLAPPQTEPQIVFVESEADFATPDQAAAKPPTQAVARKHADIPRKGIRVSAARVLALANAGARPSGVFVPARGNRPAGLALVGVSGMGVGLLDGDVLTHAGGRPATSKAAVVGMVIGARAKRTPEISGRFWRKNEAWNLIVEQPYVRQPRKGARRSAVTASL